MGNPNRDDSHQARAYSPAEAMSYHQIERELNALGKGRKVRIDISSDRGMGATTTAIRVAQLLIAAGHRVTCFGKDARFTKNLRNRVAEPFGTDCKVPIEIEIYDLDN